MFPTPAVKRLSAPRDRRAHPWFPASFPFRYQLGRSRGAGVVCKVSSGGFFVRTDRILPVGKRIRLFVDWPARLETGPELRLVITGAILGSTSKGAAIQLLNYKIQPSLDPSASSSEAGPVHG